MLLYASIYIEHISSAKNQQKNNINKGTYKARNLRMHRQNFDCNQSLRLKQGS